MLQLYDVLLLLHYAELLLANARVVQNAAVCALSHTVLLALFSHLRDLLVDFSSLARFLNLALLQVRRQLL